MPGGAGAREFPRIYGNRRTLICNLGVGLGQRAGSQGSVAGGCVASLLFFVTGAEEAFLGSNRSYGQGGAEQPQLRGLGLPWARRPRCDGRNVGKRGICCPPASPQRPPWASCSGQGRKLAFSQGHCVPDRSSILAQLIPVPQAGHHPSLRKRKGKTDRSVRGVQGQSWRRRHPCSFYGTGSFLPAQRDVTGSIWFIFSPRLHGRRRQS